VRMMGARKSDKAIGGRQRLRARAQWRHLAEVPRARLIVGAVLLFVTISAAALESLSADVREWSVGHPIAVALISGGILILITALVVEHAIAVLESRRWRTASLMAIEAYVFSAERARRRIHAEVKRQVQNLPTPPTDWTFQLRDALELILDQQRLVMRVLSDYARLQTDELAVVAGHATAALSRHLPYADGVERVAAQQARLGSIAAQINFLSFLWTGLQGQDAPAAQRHIDRVLDEIVETDAAFYRELEDLHLGVGETATDAPIRDHRGATATDERELRVESNPRTRRVPRLRSSRRSGSGGTRGAKSPRHRCDGRPHGTRPPHAAHQA
jgi:hypothetical protein